MTTRNLFCLMCLAPSLSLAQPSAAVGGVISGFLYDSSSRSIRAMLGIPGAAYIAPTVQSDLDAAAISPDGNAALASSRGRVYRITQLRQSIQSQAPARHAEGRTGLMSLWTPVDGAIAAVDRIVWQGEAGALYSSSGRQAQILSGLSQNPTAGAAIDLSALPGAVAALAVNGPDLLVGVAGSGVYVVRAGSPARLLAPAQYPAAIRATGSGLYFADRDAGQIWQIADYGLGSTPVLFAGGLDTPVALHLSGNRLLSASGSGRTLTVFDLTTHTPTGTIDLAFTPTSLDPMGSPTLLIMAAAQPGQPYYVVDISQDPAVYFVPAQGVQQ
jgi:hypothetical protein